jgi:hypothetical protein
VKSFTEAASVRIVVVLSNKSTGDKGQGIRDLVRSVSRMIKNLDKVKNSINFVFTKFDKGENVNGLL